MSGRVLRARTSLPAMTQPATSSGTADGTGAERAGTSSLTGGFVELLGLRFDEVSPDRVVITWDVTPALLQPYGIVHGGVHASVVETAASVAGATWLGDRGQVVGVNNSTDFLRAVREGTLRATAEPVHRGRLQQLWLVGVRDDTQRRVAPRPGGRPKNMGAPR